MVQQDRIVFLDVDNVGVVLADAYHGRFPAVVQRDVDVKEDAVVDGVYGNGHRRQKIPHRLFLPFRNVRNDFQLPGSVSAHDARSGGRFNALHAVGIRHDHALDVLDDVVADADRHSIRLTAQNLPCLGCGIGNGDGFGTAHCRDQLFVQSLHIGLVLFFIFIHTVVSPALILLSENVRDARFPALLPGDAPPLRMDLLRRGAMGSMK